MLDTSACTGGVGRSAHYTSSCLLPVCVAMCLTALSLYTAFVGVRSLYQVGEQ